MTSKPRGGADAPARSLVGLPAPHHCGARAEEMASRSVIGGEAYYAHSLRERMIVGV